MFPVVLCRCCGVHGSVLPGTTRTAAADPCGRATAAHNLCLREGAFLKLEGKPDSDERTKVVQEPGPVSWWKLRAQTVRSGRSTMATEGLI